MSPVPPLLVLPRIGQRAQSVLTPERIVRSVQLPFRCHFSPGPTVSRWATAQPPPRSPLSVATLPAAGRASVNVRKSLLCAASDPPVASPELRNKSSLVSRCSEPCPPACSLPLTSFWAPGGRACSCLKAFPLEAPLHPECSPQLLAGLPLQVSEGPGRSPLSRALSVMSLLAFLPPIFPPSLPPSHSL